MTTLSFNNGRSVLALAAATVSLGLATPTVAQAQMRTSSLNPCPGIYYEAPLSERFLSPEGCPENAARRAMRMETATASEMPAMATGEIDMMPGEMAMPMPTRTAATDLMPDSAMMTPPDSAGFASASQPPLPEMRDQLLARVMPMEQQVMVKLVNQSNAPITYEVFGQTDSRTLMGGESVMLRGLPLPSTISAVRQDNGMLDFKAMASEPGMLEVMLSADAMMDDNQGVLRIQEDGEVYIN